MKAKKFSRFGLAAFAAGLLAAPLSSPAAQDAAGGLAFAPEAGITHKSKDVSPPAVALDEKGTVYLAWVEEDKEGTGVYLSASLDGGKTYSTATRVNGPADAPSAIHNPPSMATGPGGEVFVAWIAPKAGAEFGSEIRFGRSADGGKTFSPSVKVNDNPAPASAGFESMTVAPGGKIYLVWLDGRERNEKNKGSSATYFAASVDGGKSFGPNVRLDGNSCPCCRTALTAGPDGTIYAAWRKALENNVREIVIASSRDGGKSFSAPAIVGHDNWIIAGCPHRGPALGVGKDGAVYAVWYSEGDSLPKIWFGHSADGGKTFRKSGISVPPGFFPDHPALAMGEHGPAMAWEEVTPVMGRIMFAGAFGAAPEQLSQGPRKSGYPALAINSAGDVAVAWSKDEMRNTRSLARVFSRRGVEGK